MAMAEHVALWPLGRLVDRYHPRPQGAARRSTGNRRAFAQAAWRHVLFGLVLGELERRLNTDGAEDEPPPVPASSNGHGNIEMAVGAA